MIKEHLFDRHDESGFTLVEVVAVSIILIILAGISVVAFKGANSFSERRACEVDVTSVVSAVKAYANDWAPAGSIAPGTYTPINVYGSSSLVPNYLSKLKPAAAGATSGQPYSISAQVKFTGNSNAEYIIAVNSAPTAGAAYYVTAPFPNAAVPANGYDATGISQVCAAVLP